ncbi:hypothetical protein OAO18_04705 [Francisellaceae bacterium]|nr:hypothetical protein [Francisellaceae bacterium]
MANKLRFGLIFALIATYTTAIANEKILFVCTGNTGRSVMAEYYANDYAQKKNLDIKATSAGVNVDPKDIKPEKNAKVVMNQQGINIKDHVAQQANIENLKNANLVITMTAKQKQALLKIDPKATNIFTLNQCSNDGNEDIEDAYGKSVTVYEETRNEIETDIKKIYDNGGKCIN